jgi:hypothetical protein
VTSLRTDGLGQVVSPPVPGLAQTLAITRAELTESRTALFVAWVLCLIFYFLQYALRSAPCVMIPELTTKFALTTFGVSSLLVMTLATGSVMFGLGSTSMAESGRLLQGAGAPFALTGAVYLAVQGSPGRRFATAIGFTRFARTLGGFCGKARGRSIRAWPERVAVVLNFYGRRLRAGRSPVAVRDTGTARAEKRVNGRSSHRSRPY